MSIVCGLGGRWWTLARRATYGLRICTMPAKQRPSPPVAAEAQRPGQRLQRLRAACHAGEILTTTELATILGRSAEGLARLRSGRRFAGYRAWRQPGGWMLTDADGLRVPGDARRGPAPDRSELAQQA